VSWGLGTESGGNPRRHSRQCQLISHLTKERRFSAKSR
jgi:hypothetical protein